MYQPDIEDVLDGLCKSLPSVEVRQGVTVEEVRQDESRVTIDGRSRTVSRSRHGHDGWSAPTAAIAWSARRSGSAHSTYNFEENWLVCDFERKGDLDRIPDMRQVCDPRQPIAIVRIGPSHHRFSFMLEPVVDVATATDRIGSGVGSPTTSRHRTPT